MVKKFKDKRKGYIYIEVFKLNMKYSVGGYKNLKIILTQETFKFYSKIKLFHNDIDKSLLYIFNIKGSSKTINLLFFIYQYALELKLPLLYLDNKLMKNPTKKYYYFKMQILDLMFNE